MATWYRWNRYSSQRFTAVEVVKETDKYVTWIDTHLAGAKEVRSQKGGEGGEFFPTREALYAFLVQRSESEVQRLKDSLHLAQSELDQIKSEAEKLQSPVEQALGKGALQRHLESRGGCD